MTPVSFCAETEAAPTAEPMWFFHGTAGLLRGAGTLNILIFHGYCFRDNILLFADPKIFIKD